jgi:hypothetical protein
MKKIFELISKILLLCVILMVCMAVFSAVVGSQNSKTTSENAILPLLIYCVLTVSTLTLIIKKSSIRGLHLVAVCFAISWGIQYFMTQIETLYFNSSVKMPLAEVFKTVIYGALYTAVICLCAVFILGGFKKNTNISPDRQKIKLPIGKSIQNIIALSLIYVAIYFIFGYFVAWQFADVRLFYTGSTHIVNFFEHMSNQFRQDPILPLFQLFRGFLWTFIANLILKSLKLKNRTAFIIIPGLIFSVLISTMLLFPNAYMPVAVRIGHSFELFTSMMAFGIISSFIFRKQFATNDGTTVGLQSDVQKGL